MLTSVVAMVPDISKSVLKELPAVKVTPQQMQQVKMMAQMMAQMIMTAVGKAFSWIQDDLTEDQKKTSTESMARAQKETEMVEAQNIMERAMGKILATLDAAQKEKWAKHIDSFISQNVPPNDDTTRAYLHAGTIIREAELQMKSL